MSVLKCSWPPPPAVWLAPPILRWLSPSLPYLPCEAAKLSSSLRVLHSGLVLHSSPQGCVSIIKLINNSIEVWVPRRFYYLTGGHSQEGKSWHLKPDLLIQGPSSDPIWTASI